MDNKNISNKPIGIFDSGLGGLTVASALRKSLPEESVIYFGDTAHLPYGDKSHESIVRYSKEIAKFLLKLNCKIIVVACNTASSVALKHVEEIVKNQAIVINVIDPVIDFLKNKNFRNIGVIGTKATIKSEAYHNKILNEYPDSNVFSLQTPLFAPMIEEGFIYDDISNAIIRSYLSIDEFKKIEALILGCTHYPLIKNQIRKFFDFSLKVIDSSEITSEYVKTVLAKNNLFNRENKIRRNYFFISDYTETFNKIAQMFFDDDISLQKLNIWHENKEDINILINTINTEN